MMSAFGDERGTSRAKAIDQEEREELCKRILGSDPESADCARYDLQRLYADAGYKVFARILESMSRAKAHARQVLS